MQAALPLQKLDAQRAAHQSLSAHQQVPLAAQRATQEEVSKRRRPQVKDRARVEDGRERVRLPQRDQARPGVDYAHQKDLQ